MTCYPFATTLISISLPLFAHMTLEEKWKIKNEWFTKTYNIFLHSWFCYPSFLSLFYFSHSFLYFHILKINCSLIHLFDIKWWERQIIHPHIFFLFLPFFFFLIFKIRLSNLLFLLHCWSWKGNLTHFYFF